MRMSHFKETAVYHQLVNGSKSKGMTSAPSKSNVERFINSPTSTVWACTKFIESSSAFCCSGLCTCFLWRFKLLLEVKVLEQIWHGRFWWSFLCWRSNLLFTKVFSFFFASSLHTHPAHTLCLRLWLLSAIFAITSVPHSPQEYDVLSCCLVWWM